MTLTCEPEFKRALKAKCFSVLANVNWRSRSHPGGGGVHDLRMEGGLPPGFQKGTFFQLPKLAVIPTFMMNFGGKPPILCYFSPISGYPTLVHRKSAEKGTLF